MLVDSEITSAHAQFFVLTPYTIAMRLLVSSAEALFVHHMLKHLELTSHSALYQGFLYACTIARMRSRHQSCHILGTFSTVKPAPYLHWLIVQLSLKPQSGGPLNKMMYSRTHG